MKGYKRAKESAGMEDQRIVDLYWQREERAIHETEKKYERYLTKIAYHILADAEDSKESVNDTYLKAWNSMPPHKPAVLSTYLGKIIRQVSIDIYRKRNSMKRRASQYAISLSELEECITDGSTPWQTVELQMLADAISAYLRLSSVEMRNVFLCRYFFMDSIREIAAYYGVSESKIKSMLYRMRCGLKEHLEKEGFAI
jgi:RNA polymerase sigma-70 factor (ECF subfamily)